MLFGSNVHKHLDDHLYTDIQNDEKTVMIWANAHKISPLSVLSLRDFVSN